LDHVCIVFIKWYAGYDDVAKSVKQQEYRGALLNLSRQCQGTEVSRPPILPVFFVDSKKFDINPVTRQEYAQFHAFVTGLNALRTQKVVAPNVAFLKVEIETRYNILTHTQFEENT
jgi:hypothetical protein